MDTEQAIRGVFAGYPEVIYAFADISYSSFADEYPSALVFAVPYGEQLTLETYTEERFENGIQAARIKLEGIVSQLKDLLRQRGVRYYVPPVAQRDETELLAAFSFKFAAVNAGLGWIGRNDVVITRRYGPRVRLSAVLIEGEFSYGERITESGCPDGCRLCVNVCPCKALRGTTWDITAKRGDIIDYQRCNRYRSAFVKKLGRKNACGLCLAVCPFGIPDKTAGEPVISGE